MRDSLPKTHPRKYECGVINLDSSNNLGTHWVAYKKINSNNVIYFDSFGNLNPPKEFVEYMKNCKIHFNYNQYQQYNTYNCGHLVLKFLYNKCI